MKETDLATTTADFEAIHTDLAKVRKNNKTVTVSRPALARLLQDHSAMWAHIEKASR